MHKPFPYQTLVEIHPFLNNYERIIAHFKPRILG